MMLFHFRKIRMMKLVMPVSCCLLSLAVSCVHAAPLEDLVESLPGYGHPKNTMFSGYLDATEGCDTKSNGDYCRLHYWLALADGTTMDADTGNIEVASSEGKEDNGTNKKPVILWLNGGPGSSSILGFLQENGPLLINATGGLMENPWSWTKVGHLLALEAPVGVGYSYCQKQEEGHTSDFACRNTDKFTASASRAALADFFARKFPELSKTDFFITGESYAGIYIPTLSKEILDNAKEVPLKGIAVGDPCTDNTAQEDAFDAIWYGHKYGLVDDATFDVLWNKCNARSPNLMAKGGKHLAAAKLNQELLQQLSPERRLEEARQTWNSPGPDFTDTHGCRMAFRKFLMSTSRGLSQGWSELYIDDYSLFAPVTSKEDDDMASYMMRPDVREALHVEEAPTTTWPGASVGFDYTKEYDACNDEAESGAWSMIDFYKDIVPRLEIAWIYNGDTDPCVSYEGTRTAVKRIGFAELDGGSYRPWFYNKAATSCAVLEEKAPLFGPDLLVQDLGAQFAGEVVNYENGLAFFTVHGSGHMVPQFRPQASLHFLDKLVHYQDLSPLFPSNETLKSASGEEFESLMNDWTTKASAAPYVTG